VFTYNGQFVRTQGFGPFLPHNQNIDFIAISPLNEAPLSGYVKEWIGGQLYPKPGVNVAVIKNGLVIETVTTDDQGFYLTSPLEGMADHYLLPNLQHYIFSINGVGVPPGGYGPIKPSQIQGQLTNFETLQNEYQVRGHVEEVVNGVRVPKPGVNISVIKNGQVIETVTTNAQGLYLTSYLEALADHYLIPDSLPHYIFTYYGQPIAPEGIGPIQPAYVSTSYLDIDAVQTEFQMNGFIKERIGSTLVPKPGVRVGIIKYGLVIETLITDADGKYTSSYLEGSANYYIRPSLLRYVFTANGLSVPPYGYGPIWLSNNVHGQDFEAIRFKPGVIGPE
ncbi:MAG: hypothetical protein KBD53_11635, partial [Candidatus Omnitrophica bacterium]|nr:hypothetical protein [Candidatus Omnitrophota bacterium]